MLEMKKTNVKILHKELPRSSYEVIRLPTISTKLPTIKGSRYQQQGAKRQKVMPLITSQADEFRSKLEAKYPSFKKTLVKSHVTGCFWMGLPQPFCRTHLPSVDTFFILENENGKHYKAKYLAQRTALSGGWREFSLAEKFSEGEVLLFQLVNSTKFKVHRIKESGLSEVNGARVTLKPDARMEKSVTYALVPEKNKETYRASPSEAVSRVEDHTVIHLQVDRIKESDLSDVNRACVTLNPDARVENDVTYALVPEKNKETHRASPPEAVSQDEDHTVILSEKGDEEDDDVVQKVENVKKNTLESNSVDSKHLKFPPNVGDYNGITTFDDFITLVDELLKKYYTLPNHIKWSYYQLCSSQKSILHADLLKGINPVLTAGCIIETVHIANEMKGCDLPTFDSNYAMWDRKLKSLKALGMNVKFLSARLLHLEKIASNSEATKNRQKYVDLCSEHADSENIIKSLQDKLNDLRRVAEKRADAIEKLKADIKEHELRFRKQVSAPW